MPPKKESLNDNDSPSLSKFNPKQQQKFSNQRATNTKNTFLLSTLTNLSREQHFHVDSCQDKYYRLQTMVKITKPKSSNNSDQDEKVPKKKTCHKLTHLHAYILKVRNITYLFKNRHKIAKKKTDLAGRYRTSNMSRYVTIHHRKHLNIIIPGVSEQENIFQLFIDLS